MYYDEDSTRFKTEQILRDVPDDEILNYIESYVYKINIEDLKPHHIKEENISIIIRLDEIELLIIDRYDKLGKLLFESILNTLKEIAKHNEISHQKRDAQREYQEYLKLKEKYDK